VRRARFEADPGAVVDELEGALAYPLFTKPARQGSSIGISKATDAASLRAGLVEALEWDDVVIVEEAVNEPRELEVGVLGNTDVEVTPPGEIKPSHEFYDFEAKYLDDSELVIPAEVADDVAGRIQDIAREAYVSIGCRGMARIDFFLSGSGQLYLNEINTIPGFTPNSMFPRLWAAQGLEYPALVDRLLTLAIEAG
jgi:D-alanine-D-alanine ligase